jgi:hypothetical protein
MFAALNRGRFLDLGFLGGFWTFFNEFWTLFSGFWTFSDVFWTLSSGLWTFRHFLEKPHQKNSQFPSGELAVVYFSKVAFIKSRNSGCGRVGLETNSGWNCDATNHGWSVSSMISTRRPSGLVPENTNPASSIS